MKNKITTQTTSTQCKVNHIASNDRDLLLTITKKNNFYVNTSIRQIQKTGENTDIHC